MEVDVVEDDLELVRVVTVDFELVDDRVDVDAVCDDPSCVDVVALGADSDDVLVVEISVVGWDVVADAVEG